MFKTHTDFSEFWPSSLYIFWIHVFNREKYSIIAGVHARGECSWAKSEDEDEKYRVQNVKMMAGKKFVLQSEMLKFRCHVLKQKYYY